MPNIEALGILSGLLVLFTTSSHLPTVILAPILTASLFLFHMAASPAVGRAMYDALLFSIAQASFVLSASLPHAMDLPQNAWAAGVAVLSVFASNALMVLRGGGEEVPTTEYLIAAAVPLLRVWLTRAYRAYLHQSTPYISLAPYKPAVLMGLGAVALLLDPRTAPIGVAPFVLMYLPIVKANASVAIPLLASSSLLIGITWALIRDQTALLVSLAVTMTIQCRHPPDHSVSDGAQVDLPRDVQALNNTLEGLYRASVLPNDGLTAQVLNQHLPVLFGGRRYAFKAWRAYPGEHLTEMVSLGQPLTIANGDLDVMFPPSERTYVIIKWQLPMQEDRDVAVSPGAPRALNTRRMSLRHEIAKSIAARMPSTPRRPAAGTSTGSASPIRRRLDTASGIGSPISVRSHMDPNLLFSPGAREPGWADPVESPEQRISHSTFPSTEELFCVRRDLPTALCDAGIVGATTVTSRTAKNCVVVCFYAEFVDLSHPQAAFVPPDFSFLSELTSLVGVSVDRQLFTDQLQVRVASDSDRTRSQEFYLAELYQRVQTPVSSIMTLSDTIRRDTVITGQESLADHGQQISTLCRALLDSLAGSLSSPNVHDVNLYEMLHIKAQLFHTGGDFAVFIDNDLPPVLQVHEVCVFGILDAIIANAVRYSTEWVTLDARMLRPDEARRFQDVCDTATNNSHVVSRMARTGGSLLCVTVTNTGGGIPFSRMTGRTDPYIDGQSRMHAGLATARQLIAQCNGALELVELNGVTTARLVVPVMAPTVNDTRPRPDLAGVAIEVHLDRCPREQDAVKTLLTGIGATIVNEGGVGRVTTCDDSSHALEGPGGMEHLHRPVGMPQLAAVVERVLGLV